MGRAACWHGRVIHRNRSHFDVHRIFKVNDSDPYSRAMDFVVAAIIGRSFSETI